MWPTRPAFEYQGVLAGEERFGYVELSTRDWRSPAMSLDAPPLDGSAPPPFIEVRIGDGEASARFDVLMDFDFTGRPVDWQRLRNENLD